MEYARDGFDLCGAVFQAVPFEDAGERDPVSDDQQDGVDQQFFFLGADPEGPLQFETGNHLEGRLAFAHQQSAHGAVQVRNPRGQVREITIKEPEPALDLESKMKLEPKILGFQRAVFRNFRQRL